MCQVIIWLCNHVMRFQSKTHISPLLTIESPVAQWLERSSRSWVQIPSGTRIFYRVDVISTFETAPENQIRVKM